jgi:hypothetical protein
MKIVLSALLSECEIQPVGDTPERPRRRNITVRPARGARVVLRDRARDRVPVAA